MHNAFTHGYALLVGVGESAYPAWSLPVTVRDIQAIRAILTDPNLCAYPGDDRHIRLIHDKTATRAAILDGLAWLEAQAAADPDAIAVVFYSGHGWLDESTSRYYLIPHDVEPCDVAVSALPAQEFTDALREIKAKRLLVMIDCCHAEGMATAKKGPAAIKLPSGLVQTAPPKGLVEQLKQGEGRAVFTSSRGQQLSWIHPDGSLSIYTHHLVEALQGAGNKPGDTVVRLSNLMNHLGKAVPESARTLYQTEQVPFFDTAAEDFAVAMLRGGKGLPQEGWEGVKQEAAETILHVVNVLAHGPGSVAAGGDITGSQVTTVGTQLNLFFQRPPLGVPFQVPPLPAHFVPRPAVSRDLKARLLADGPTAGSLVVSAVHGLGGVGKSTLAADLAHDSEVMERFPDGVLWATLGQQPDLLPLLSGWVQALGDYNFKPLGKKAATSHLRTLLHDKAALLVVDDAWDPAQVPPFLFGGPRCRVVITTRDATIAKAVGATLYDLDVMSPEQALALLAGWLDRGLEGTERDQALLLAKAVGYLPLALELAAAQVADGIRWAELLEDLKAEVARLEALELSDEEVIDEATSKRLSLLSSFYLSLRRLSEPRRRDFAWLGVLPEDATIVPAIATVLWGTDERSARTTLRHLCDKALLQPGIPWPDGTLTYRLHDLLRNLARRLLTTPSRPDRPDDLSGLGLTMRAAHAALLERYWARTQGGLWHTLTDDGYIYIHLTWHLEQAGQEDKLHALMREETAEGRNGWYEARERLGQVAGYLSDVDRAWQLAEEAFADRGSPIAIGLQCRYALITASLNSLARNIPPTLLAALVEKGIWPGPQGLAYVRQLQEPELRTGALAALAPRLAPTERDQALREALEAARAIGDEGSRSEALAALAPHLTEPWLRQALEAARAIETGWYRTKPLAALAPRWRSSATRPRRWRRRGPSRTWGPGPRRWRSWPPT